MTVTKEEVQGTLRGAVEIIRNRGMIKSVRSTSAYDPSLGPVCGTGALGVAICGNPWIRESGAGREQQLLQAALAAMGMDRTTEMYSFNDDVSTTKEMLLQKFEEGIGRAASPDWEVPEFHEIVVPKTQVNSMDVVIRINIKDSVVISAAMVEQTQALAQSWGVSMSMAAHQLQEAMKALAPWGVSVDAVVLDEMPTAHEMPTAWEPFVWSYGDERTFTTTGPRRTSASIPSQKRCGAEGRLHGVGVTGYRRRRDRRGGHRRWNQVEEESLVGD